MEKVTGVPGEHMTREQTLDGVEEIIGKMEVKGKADDSKKDADAKPEKPDNKEGETQAKKTIQSLKKNSQNRLMRKNSGRRST